MVPQKKESIRKNNHSLPKKEIFDKNSKTLHLKSNTKESKDILSIKNSITEGYKHDKSAQNYLDTSGDTVSEGVYVKMQTAAESYFQSASNLLEKMSKNKPTVKEKKKLDELRGILYYASGGRYGEKQKTSKLKTVGNFIVVFFLIAGTLFLSPTITGNIVKNTGLKSGSIIGIIFIVLGILTSFFLIRQNLNRGRFLKN